MRDPVLIHLHVPKCAGGAVNVVLREHFGARVLHTTRAKTIATLEEGRNDRFDAVTGHLYFGVHSYFDRPALYFSAVRDPIARVCSFFNFTQTQPRAALHKPMKQLLRDLDDLDDNVFLTLRSLKRRWCNAMCRAYTGIEGVNAMAWDEVWPIIADRIATGQLVVRDLDGIAGFLAAEGIHAGGPLPQQKVTQLDRFDDYVVARPETLRPATIDRLRALNQHDLRLMEALRAAGHVAA